MKCEICGAEKQLLLTSYSCPDEDKHEAIKGAAILNDFFEEKFRLGAEDVKMFLAHQDRVLDHFFNNELERKDDDNE